MLEPIQDNDNYKPHAKIIQIYPCLLQLSRKQESVTDGQTAAITISPRRYRVGIIKQNNKCIYNKNKTINVFIIKKTINKFIIFQK